MSLKPEREIRGGGVIPASAVILGGGSGRRMGGNKLFLAAEGQLLFERILFRLSPLFHKMIISVGPRDREPLEELLKIRYPKENLQIVEDTQQGRGPLEGLASALEYMDTEWAFLIGCDMLQVQQIIVQTMWMARKDESQIICARLKGFLEPLHAFYSVSCLPMIKKNLSSGHRKLKAFYHEVNLTVVEEESLMHLPGYGRSFSDVNTPEELARLLDPRFQ